MKNPGLCLKTNLCLWMFLASSLLFLLHAQEPEEEEIPPEEVEANELPSDTTEALEGAESVAALAEKLLTSFGFTYQKWSPFTEVTSSVFSGLSGVTTGETAEGENTKENINPVSSEASLIYTFEMRGGSFFENTHLDLSNGSDLSRLNPFKSQTEESSKKRDLEKSLKEEKVQTTRLSSEMSLLNFSETMDVVVKITEDHFVSQVTPSKDTLFISFSGSEAVIDANKKIQLETSFEDVMTGISNFTFPWTDIPVGFVGYFELKFQKPILLPLSQLTPVEDQGNITNVDAVIIFPQFSASGWMIEWNKSLETGFDFSAHFKFGDGKVNIGKGSARVNKLLTNTNNEDGFFSRKGTIGFSGGLLRASYLGELGEISLAGEWRVFVVKEEFNGIKAGSPLSVDLITSLEVLYSF